MPKPSIIRTSYRLNNAFDDIVSNYMDADFSFSLGVGKYSHFINFGRRIEKYITHEQSRRTFIGYAKLLADLKREEIQDILSDIKDSVSEQNNRYFDVGIYRKCFHDTVYCVDLNSAYLQSLLNIELIRPSTFTWINEKLTKYERLVAVGLLAKQKTIYNYSDGIQTGEPELKTSDKRYIFNCVIQMVDQAMTHVRELNQENFLFYWVDGIYLLEKEIATDVKELLENMGYPCKLEVLTNFTVTDRFETMNIEFDKEKPDGEIERKSFNVPITEIFTDIQNNVRNVINANSIHGHMKKAALYETMPHDHETKAPLQTTLF